MQKIIEVHNTEKEIFLWWLKIRWFIVIVLFAIGILRVGQMEQTYPIIIFIGTFLGISILNILFHLQIIKSTALAGALQITLDVIFASLVVHLTGGMESDFVWIYLLAVITASLTIEKAGGFIAAMIGSMCMLLMIIMYSYGWLIPIDISAYKADIPSQTIFLISYTTLFTGVAFISSFISSLLSKTVHELAGLKHEIEEYKEKIVAKQKLISGNQDSLIKYKEVVDVASSIAGIDHAINNPLTIISLSIRRIKKAASEYNDTKLAKSSDQMTEAINAINGVLVRLQKLKHLDLIIEERKKQQG